MRGPELARKGSVDEKIYLHPKLSALVPGAEDVGFPDTGSGASWAMVRGGSVTIAETMGTGECLLTVSGWGSISYHATGEGVGMASICVLWNYCTAYCVVINAKKVFSTIYHTTIQIYLFSSFYP